MILSVIEKTKNDILLRCSTYNESIINFELVKIVDSEIYKLAEDLSNLLISFGIDENVIRNNISNEIKQKIIKKIKRKLFVDSLALQVTNEYFVEKFYNKQYDYNTINIEFINELNRNKDSNQLNLAEDLDLKEIYEYIVKYIKVNILPIVNENTTITNEVDRVIAESEYKLKTEISNIIKQCDNKYLEILIEELKKNNERVNGMEDKSYLENNYKFSEFDNFEFPEEIKSDNFDIESLLSSTPRLEEKPKPSDMLNQYDDMTLYNKLVLSLNTEEEKLIRKEQEQRKQKEEIDKKLGNVNEIIEKNLDKQELLSKLDMQLREKEADLNNKLAEADVIFLNMMPLIKSLNEMKEKVENKGDNNE